MEQITNIEKSNHSLKITVHDSFVEVMVIMPQDLYCEVIMQASRAQMKGFANRFDYERFMINDFKQHIFNEESNGIVNFTYKEELYNYMIDHSVNTVNDNNNGWFKKVCFNISASNSLNSILTYIRKKSSEFETSNNYRLPQ